MCVSDSVGPAFSNFKRYPAASCTRYAKLLDEYQKRPTRLISTISGTYAWDHDYYFRRSITKVKIRPIDRRSISIPLLFLARLPFMRFNILVGMHAYCPPQSPLLFGRGTFSIRNNTQHLRNRRIFMSQGEQKAFGVHSPHTQT